MLKKVSLYQNKKTDLLVCLFILVRETGLSSRLTKAPPGLSPESSRPMVAHIRSSCQVQSYKNKKDRPSGLSFLLVRETGLEPVRLRHTHLKRACLPIPALSHICFATLTIIPPLFHKVKPFFAGNPFSFEKPAIEKSIAGFVELYKQVRRNSSPESGER